jgi:hypothetical protein
MRNGIWKFTVRIGPARKLVFEKKMGSEIRIKGFPRSSIAVGRSQSHQGRHVSEFCRSSAQRVHLKDTPTKVEVRRVVVDRTD